MDAGAYARLLMAHAKDAAEASLVQQPERPLSAQDILEAAYLRTNVQGEGAGARAGGWGMGGAGKRSEQEAGWVGGGAHQCAGGGGGWRGGQGRAQAGDECAG